ncbi:MAG TPA: 4Fe-4S binding protein [Bacteroidales bacterium]|nr:4Fe-4S binding protein [Bacteroidales bacterium]HPF04114.1 4Fe-4S binding protein [Bacteroidales bacterium]HPJ59066.1 4Fe-4S binding protein [Bacteroidales bacterium]HPR13176.1 4Fe-4S binding protein [Bacteroidales bacterium]HRW84756.1 4Fe-4S binding protein [Bacteroidales bacterium]
MVNSKRIRYLVLGLTILFALPLHWGILTGITNWLSPYIALNSILALRSLVFLNIIGLSVLAAFWFRKNFFCRYLCPAGAVLDHVPSPARSRKKFSLRKVPRIGKWLVVMSLAGAAFGLPLFIYLDPLAIFHTFFSAFVQTTALAVAGSMAGLAGLLVLQYFMPGLWCFRLCPLGGLQMLVTDIRLFAARKLRRKQKTDLGRRLFIGSVAGAIIARVIPSALAGKENIIHPPASLEQGKMAMVCTRCGNCLKSCPTRILKEDIRFTAGFLTPVVIFEDGYCLETCNKCGIVCPSGAITPFDPGAKKGIRMGLAVVRSDDCLLSTLKECDRCRAACPYNAVEIAMNQTSGLMLPAISERLCVGCGACKVICPVSCIDVIG